MANLLETRRITALMALPRGGRSTLFAWILAEAPRAELDKGSPADRETVAEQGIVVMNGRFVIGDEGWSS